MSDYVIFNTEFPDGKGVNFTEEEKIARQKQEESTNKKIEEFEALSWKRHRVARYPDIGDQLDDLYHAGAFSVDMAAKLKKVKDDNPKG